MIKKFIRLLDPSNSVVVYHKLKKNTYKMLFQQLFQQLLSPVNRPMPTYYKHCRPTSPQGTVVTLTAGNASTRCRRVRPSIIRIIPFGCGPGWGTNTSRGWTLVPMNSSLFTTSLRMRCESSNCSFIPYIRSVPGRSGSNSTRSRRRCSFD